MSLNYLNLLLVFGSALSDFSLALGYPNHKPLSEYKPISPPSYRPSVPKSPSEYKQVFRKPPISVILQHPESSKKPLVGNHRPSPASSHPVSFNKPQLPPRRPEHPVSAGNNPPPPTRKAYVGHPPAENTGN